MLLTHAKNVLNTLIKNGYEAYFVGGFVRDYLLNCPCHDVDIATSATPEEVMNLFERCILTGVAHGTVTVMQEHIPFEVTTFRTESTYHDFRRPSEVAFTTSLHEDLKRRDFTINAMAMSADYDIIDPFNGQADLQNNILKAVGEANERFFEDPLRILRAIRFVAKLGFTIETQTNKALAEQAHLLKHISKERIKKELAGVFEGHYRQEAITILLKTKSLESIGLSQLMTYDGPTLASLCEVTQLFMLAGATLEETQHYISQWPFSKKERHIIQAYERYCKHPKPLALVRYDEGDEFMYHLGYLMQALHNEVLELPSLPMTSRREMNISSKQIMQTLNREAGVWLGGLLRKIEVAIVLGNIKNETEEILTYIKEV